MRSLLGGSLPLAGPTMYKAMTPQWAGTFLGLLEVCMIPIPFIFYKYGDRIRAKSPLIRQMRADLEKSEQRVARAKRAADRRAATAEKEAGAVDEEAEVGDRDGVGIEDKGPVEMDVRKTTSPVMTEKE